MDLLRKYWDKLVMTLALLGLILSAMFLAWRIDELNTETREGPRHHFQGETVAPVNQGPYTNALMLLKEPVLWTKSPLDIFGQTTPVIIRTDDTSTVTKTTDVVSLLQVIRIPFKLLFKAYTSGGHNFQLNFREFGWTFFIQNVGDPVKDREVDTGYRVIKFEPKTIEVDDPSTGSKRLRDVSVLTLQRGKEKPVPLLLGQEAEEQEPWARVRCDPGWPGKPTEFRVRRGTRFPCANHTYNVFDISSGQMIIVDQQTGEKQPIPLRTGNE